MDGGIRLTADGERGSRGAGRCEDGFRAGGGGASVQPRGVRGSGDPSQRKVNATPHVCRVRFFSLSFFPPFSLSPQPVQLLP